MTNIKQRIEEFNNKQREKDLAYELNQQQFLKEHFENQVRFNQQCRPHIRRANVDDYKKWLVGYLKKGNLPTHFYDRNFDSDFADFFIAIDHFVLMSLYGASSINLIIPENIEVVTSELGHSKLYLMKNFEHRGDWVPLYSNIEFEDD